MLLLGSRLSQAGVGRMGAWVPTLLASLWPHSSAVERLTQVSQRCAGRGWWPGPSLVLCGDAHPPRCPPAWLSGQPPVPSPVPAAVTQPVPSHRQPPSVIQVGGIHFPPAVPIAAAAPGTARLWGVPWPGGVCRDLVGPHTGTGMAPSRDREGRETCPPQSRAPTPCHCQPLLSSVSPGPCWCVSGARR